MKEKIVLLCLCIMIFPSVCLLSNADSTEPPQYSIGIYGNSIELELTVFIMNIGNTTEINIPWSIEVQRFPGSGPLSKKQFSGTIDQIAPQEIIYLNVGRVVGFKLQSFINITVGNQNEIAGWRTIIGPFLIDSTFRPYTTPHYPDLYYSDFIARFTSSDYDTEVKVLVTNIGNEVRTQVSWYIGFPQQHFPNSKVRFSVNNGVISQIAPGESVTIKSAPVFGFYLWSNIGVSVDGYGAAFDYRHIIGSHVITPRFVPNYS